MSEPAPGWEAPIYTGLTEPLLIAKVPHTFFILDTLLTLMIGLYWWPMVIIGGATYLIARVGTAYDDRWNDVLLAHLRYRDFYEG